jgi:cytidine deaminase
MAVAVSHLTLAAGAQAEPPSPDLQSVLLEKSRQLPSGAREKLQALFRQPDFSGVIPAEHARALTASLGGEADRAMVSLLDVARAYSRPPISGYRVGAVCQGGSGRLYLGANVEMGGQTLGFSLHAEQSAVANAIANGERTITALAASSAPCGHCRQFLNELQAGGGLRIVRPDHPPSTLKELLPDAFGPHDLGLVGGPLDFVERHLATDGPADALVEAAVSAAARSYAPITKAYSGVALRMDDGQVIAGSYLENAAFNPSVPPLQAAVARLILSGHDPARIASIVLAEVHPAPISQEPVTRALIRTIAKDATVRVVHVSPAQPGG